MGWPAGQINGGIPYRDLFNSELLPSNTAGVAAALPQVLGAGSELDFHLPWGADGYTLGQMLLYLTTGGGAPSTVQVSFIPIDSDANVSAAPFWGAFSGAPILLVAPVAPVNSAYTDLVFTFSDDPTPGNYVLYDEVGNVEVERGQCRAFPVGFEGAAALIMRLKNTGANNVTVNGVAAKFRGRKR